MRIHNIFILFANALVGWAFRADQHTAVLVLECTSAEETAGILATLPFVRDGRIGLDFIPLTAYTGFSRLFGVDEILD